MRRLRWAVPGMLAAAALAVTPILVGTRATAQSQPASYKSCLRHADSTVAMEECITAERTRLRRALAAAYDRVAARPGLGDRGIHLLAAGQRAWRRFERRDCEFPGWLVRGGTLEPLEVGECLVARETQRLAVLRGYATFPD